MIFKLKHSINQPIAFESDFGVSLHIKREDRIHPMVSGNKYRKLKYNLLQARHQKYDTLLTFGGAYSNHIAAVASVGQGLGFKTIGVIRGDELQHKKTLNNTLSFSKACGMTFEFVSRNTYREKTSDSFSLFLEKKYGSYYYIPEGGTNDLAVRGCQEILQPDDACFDYVCCPVGTGGTLAGLIKASGEQQKILGFPALKGHFLHKVISQLAPEAKGWVLVDDYHFGGYAKVNPRLIEFINQFKETYNIQLDPVYTGKMMYGIMDLIAAGYFSKNTRILAIHTGGLQGIAGMNHFLRTKNYPLIQL